MDAAALQRELLVRADRLRQHIRAKLPPALRCIVTEDDILQDACAVAFRQVKQFDLQGLRSFDAWITMVTNQCLADVIKLYRRRKRGGGVLNFHAHYDASSCLNLFNGLAGPCPTPSSEIAIKEAVSCVREAVAALPEDQRRAVELHHFEGRSYADISAAMQKSVPAVRGLIQRAVQTLRSDLGRASRFFSDASLSEDRRNEPPV
jgi:RNA polymerase sigma-70 factor (ECF subfamily)